MIKHPSKTSEKSINTKKSKKGRRKVKKKAIKSLKIRKKCTEKLRKMSKSVKKRKVDRKAWSVEKSRKIIYKRERVIKRRSLTGPAWNLLTKVWSKFERFFFSPPATLSLRKPGSRGQVETSDDSFSTYGSDDLTVNQWKYGQVEEDLRTKFPAVSSYFTRVDTVTRKQHCCSYGNPRGEETTAVLALPLVFWTLCGSVEQVRNESIQHTPRLVFLTTFRVCILHSTMPLPLNKTKHTKSTNRPHYKPRSSFSRCLP